MNEKQCIEYRASWVQSQSNKDIWILSTGVALVSLFVNFKQILRDKKHIYLVFLFIILKSNCLMGLFPRRGILMF